MTPTAMLITLAGLSHREASEFLNIRLDTVQSYFRRNRPTDARDGVKAELKKLIARQEQAAAEALELIEQQTAGRPESLDVEIGYPADDHEAQALGFPCVGAWQAMAARVVARSLAPIRLVHRGATPATAAATDAHERSLRAWPVADRKTQEHKVTSAAGCGSKQWKRVNCATVPRKSPPIST